MAAKYTRALFLEKARDVHGDKYDYSSVDWVNYSTVATKVPIICPMHGQFIQSVDRHLNSNMGCHKCSGSQISLDSFIKKARDVHGDKYDYSSVDWTPTTLGQSKVTIKCWVHGCFEQTIDNHINTQTGCPTCADKTHTLDSFIKKARDVHGDKYDYSSVDWTSTTNNRSTISIICPTHGVFKQAISGHINHQHGCTKCSSSKGEIAIARLLDQYNIAYIQEYKFPVCRNPKTGKFMRFDFWLPGYTMCIEFHGEQHYHPVLFGNKGALDPEARSTLASEQLTKIQYRDSIKEQYCKQNNIQLIIIPYTAKEHIADLLCAALSIPLAPQH